MPQDSVICPVWLNIFVRYLNEGDEETFAKFANDSKLGSMTNIVDKKKDLKRFRQVSSD